MPAGAATRSPKYLYAVAAGAGDRQYGPFGIGGGHIYTISDGGVAAVVSDVEAGRIRPERRHLAAHQAVLKQLMQESTVLPMSFGIIADGPGGIRRILSRNHQAFQKQLRQLAGKVEMGLRVSWEVPSIFGHFVHTYADLREARDRMVSSGRQPTRDEKIELGQMFERILGEERERHTRKVEQVLQGRGCTIKRNKWRAEQEVMNLACLVARDGVPGFEAGVEEAAALFDDSLAFNYNGPWAPHNFIINEQITL